MALSMLALGEGPVSVPLSFALFRLERSFGQPPGSHREWDADDLLRALLFQSLEASVKVSDA